jgi:hypothetical protein
VDAQTGGFKKERIRNLEDLELFHGTFNIFCNPPFLLLSHVSKMRHPTQAECQRNGKTNPDAAS